MELHGSDIIELEPLLSKTGNDVLEAGPVIRNENNTKWKWNDNDQAGISSTEDEYENDQAGISSTEVEYDNNQAGISSTELGSGDRIRLMLELRDGKQLKRRSDTSITSEYTILNVQQERTDSDEEESTDSNEELYRILRLPSYEKINTHSSTDSKKKINTHSSTDSEEEKIFKEMLEADSIVSRVMRTFDDLPDDNFLFKKTNTRFMSRSHTDKEKTTLKRSQLENKKLLSSSQSDKEIQGQQYLNNKLSHYDTFHGYKVAKAVDGEKVQQALRIVIPDTAVDSDNKNKSWDIGTIVNVDEDGTVQVKWDRPGMHIQEIFKKEDNNQYKLLLYDNTQTGVTHRGYKCETCKMCPIRGMKWTCLICQDSYLCSSCYMGDEHKLNHIFKRTISPDSKPVELPLRLKAKKIREKMTCSLNVKPQGKHYPYEAKGTRDIVKDNDGSMTTDAVEPKCWDSFYPDHLPVLGQCSDGYFNVWIDDCDFPNKKKADYIRVYLWRTINTEFPKTKVSSQSTLYLIFANSEDDDQVDKMALMNEICLFAKNTKLPCHLIGQRVMFHSGSTDNVCIHYKTDRNTIQELIENGYKKFARGSTVENEDSEGEITYFKRMAEYAIGQKVLPVIILLRKGGLKSGVPSIAENSQIPIIRLEKNTSDVYVLWFSDDYRADINNPWCIQEIKEKGNFDTLDEIELLSNFRWNLETLVCSLIIGVYMEKESFEDEHCETLDYVTAFSISLLKRRKWRIPKNYINKTIGQPSLEYVCQKVVTSEFIKEFWKTFTNMGYELPDYRELTTTNEKDAIDDSVVRQKDSHVDYLLKKGHTIQLSNWDSECYGLLFCALLQRHYWAGATQLVETGYIGLHYILLGCSLLEEDVNDWKTTTIVKEELQRLKNAFTERAICITSCIYDVDTNTKDAYYTTSGDNLSGKTSDEKAFGDSINHAGRLLLNHGYLRDAIKTENNTYLEHDTVKKIINTKWYGIEKINCQTICTFVFLSAVHLFVLPLLMVNMEALPLRRLYEKFQLPFLKVVIHMMGFFVLILAYAYMLLFDYSDDGISNTDYFIIIWIASFVVDEIKQVIVAFIRDKLNGYASDWWNILDWLLIVVYTAGMLLRISKGYGFQIASKCVLVTAFMLLCIRILNLCCMTKLLGPKLVIIRKMIKETVAFMMIMTVIVVWYSVSFYALLYPNSEFTWTQIEKVISNGYWMLFGELNLDADTLTVPDCSFNRTVYESGVLQRCPTQLGLYLTPYLKAFYGLIAVVLLLNLLIAMYSDTFNAVQQKSDFYWRQIQSECLEEYSIKTVFPIHLQLLALPGIICALMCLFCLYLREKSPRERKLNDRPMVVRVFLFDSNYDLKLTSTKEAEENATVKTNRKLDLTEFDTIMVGEEQKECTFLSWLCCF